MASETGFLASALCSAVDEECIKFKREYLFGLSNFFVNSAGLLDHQEMLIITANKRTNTSRLMVA
jgi:hypothetical protein